MSSAPGKTRENYERPIQQVMSDDMSGYIMIYGDDIKVISSNHPSFIIDQ